MKKAVLPVLGLVCSLLCAGVVTARAQMRDEPSKGLGSAEAKHQPYISPGRHHKLLLTPSDAALHERLRSQKAIVKEVAYDDSRLVVVDEAALGGRQALLALPVPLQDEQNLMDLQGYLLDTTAPEATLRQLPATLRRTDMADALARGAAPGSGLYLVQFVGPVQDAWLESLTRTGVELISHPGRNAYLVRAGRDAAARLSSWKREHGFVQFVGDYEPAFRMSPSLREKLRAPAGTRVDIIVSVPDGSSARKTLDALDALALESQGTREAYGTVRKWLTVEAARLSDIARLEDVLSVEEKPTVDLLDEAQGQIVAGNLNANGTPTGPGYLAWLATKGFSSIGQFGSFVVNVVDDAPVISGHPDLPSARIAFETNPTSQSAQQSGHGFMVASIVGGHNTGVGAAVEDAKGYNFGLGVAPFARVGATAMNGPGLFDPPAWESSAYGKSARISTNSWTRDPPTNSYDGLSAQYDQIVRDAQSATPGLQPMIVIFAAGNEGPAPGTVQNPNLAKNVLTVGGTEGFRAGLDSCGFDTSLADNATELYPLSSRGPTSDGRKKPDLMAPATHITSAVPSSNYVGMSLYSGPESCAAKFWPPGQTLYTWQNGTSMAAPAVAGGVALLYQDFLNKSLAPPSPAMAKAYLMNSASYMTGLAGEALPSNNQGMGRMDLNRAFDGVPRLLVDQSKVFNSAGEVHQLSGFIHDSGKPFRVTLAWTDPPGQTLVNNLDLSVTVNGQTYKGNVFSGANSIPGGNDDTVNNHESIFIPAGHWGPFTLTVKATSLGGDGLPGNADPSDQDFALVAYNGNAGSQLLLNGGFEGTLNPWLSGKNAFQSSTSGFAHSGTGYLYMKVDQSSVSMTSQEVIIPATAASAHLSFWLRVNSLETTQAVTDTLAVEVIDVATNATVQLATYSNLDSKAAGYEKKGGFDLSGFKGKKVRLQFKANSNATKETVFRIDDVTLLTQ